MGLEDGAVYVAQQSVANSLFRKTNILVLGGSSEREFFPGDTEASAWFSKACGRPLTVFNAGTSDQSLADSAAIADSLWQAGARPKVIVVGLTADRLTRDAGSWASVLTHQRVPLPAPQSIMRLMDPLSQFSWRLGDVGAQISRVALLVKSATFHWNSWQPQLQKRHLYHDPPLAPDSKRMLSLVGVSLIDPLLKKYASISANHYADVFDIFRDRGVTIIYLYTPISPISATVLTQEDQDLGPANSILRNHGQVLSLRHDGLLTDDDFHDEQHLLPRGRATYWDPSKPLTLLASKLCAAA